MRIASVLVSSHPSTYLNSDRPPILHMQYCIGHACMHLLARYRPLPADPRETIHWTDSPTLQTEPNR